MINRIDSAFQLQFLRHVCKFIFLQDNANITKFTFVIIQLASILWDSSTIYGIRSDWFIESMIKKFDLKLTCFCNFFLSLFTVWIIL